MEQVREQEDADEIMQEQPQEYKTIVIDLFVAYARLVTGMQQQQ